MSDLFAGVDAGGSGTTAVLIDAHGLELGRLSTGPSGFQDSGPEAAAAAVGGLLGRLREEVAARVATAPPPAGLVCAMAGGGDEEKARALHQALERAAVARRVEITTDAEAARFDAFANGAGIVLIAGTGSIALGRSADGRTARAGGRRAPGGDPGGGVWIGERAIEAVRRDAGAGAERRPAAPPLHSLAAGADGGLAAALRAAADADLARLLAVGERRPHEVARLARAVGAAAESGNPEARRILAAAAAELAALLADVFERLGPWASPAPIALAGGLLAPGRPLRAPTEEALQRLALPLLVHARAVDGARGAAAIARRTGE